MRRITRVGIVTDRDDIRKLCEFLLLKPEGYPNYESWVRKAADEIRLGHKKAFACVRNDEMIADLILQRDKKDRLSLEIKNMRVDPRCEGNRIGSRILKLAEGFAAENGFRRIVGDIHSSDRKTINFFLKRGFSVLAEEKLYRKEQMETIVFKDIQGH